LYLGELRALTIKTIDGNTIGAAGIIDCFWQGLVDWATVEQPRLAADNQYQVLKPVILEHQNGQRILVEFDALTVDSDVSGQR
jgi:hypothetical protein